MTAEREQYSTCSLCQQKVRVVAFQYGEVHVDLKMCMSCDRRQCSECDRLDGKTVYVADAYAQKCPAGHWLTGNFNT